jgi:hypothetical protein
MLKKGEFFPDFKTVNYCYPVMLLKKCSADNKKRVKWDALEKGFFLKF